MLLKLYSSLATYIYAYSSEEIYVNLLIDSTVETDSFRAVLENGKLSVNSRGREMTLRIRIPEYAKHFSLRVNGTETAFQTQKGYAVLHDTWTDNDIIEIRFDAAPRLVFCDPRATDNLGQVAVMYGPVLYCAEGFDNDGCVDFTVSATPGLTVDGNTIRGERTDGKPFTLIPYFRWCNRESEDQALRAMRVWLPFAAMPDSNTLAKMAGDRLYSDLFS